jgi:hypothetical protein
MKIVVGMVAICVLATTVGTRADGALFEQADREAPGGGH